MDNIPLPELRKAGRVTQLNVRDKPFLILGGSTAMKPTKAGTCTSTTASGRFSASSSIGTKWFGSKQKVARVKVVVVKAANLETEP